MSASVVPNGSSRFTGLYNFVLRDRNNKTVLNCELSDTMILSLYKNLLSQEAIIMLLVKSQTQQHHPMQMSQTQHPMQMSQMSQTHQSMQMSQMSQTHNPMQHGYDGNNYNSPDYMPRQDSIYNV
jgi:hypothetical protein